MIELSVTEVAKTLQAIITGNIETKPTFPSVSIDSRTIAPGQCFVAIKGTRLDGHNFLEEALEKGASLIIHSDSSVNFPMWKDRIFMQVDDTTSALQVLSHYVRKKWNRSVIAITGSIGKTTTREFISSLLGQRFKICQSPSNFNNEIGVPLSLLQLNKEDDLAVLELGMNHSGEIRLLSNISSPNFVLLTNIAAVHLEFFPDLDAIATAKGEILENLTQKEPLFFNADDHRISKLASSYTGPKISFGLHKKADIRISNYQIENLEKMNFQINSDQVNIKATVPFAGEHLLYNIAAAVAVATSFNLSKNEISQGIKQLKIPSMRGQILRIGKPGNQLTIWDDCYNSNPESLRVILETINYLKDFQRKILALGEMLELGPTGPNFHYEVGKQIAQSSTNLLVTVGEGGLEIGRGAQEAGFPSKKSEHFKTAEQATDFLIDQIVPGDFLLVKGSRRVAMDKIVKQIINMGGPV